jgi:hypothetical protein
VFWPTPKATSRLLFFVLEKDGIGWLLAPEFQPDIAENPAMAELTPSERSARVTLKSRPVARPDVPGAWKVHDAGRDPMATWPLARSVVLAVTARTKLTAGR